MVFASYLSIAMASVKANGLSGTTGNTGFVDFTGTLIITPGENPPGDTPLPGVVWLLLGMFYRKKEKPKSDWA